MHSTETERARELVNSLRYADKRGLAPPQNWTTRAADIIAAILAERDALVQELERARAAPPPESAQPAPIERLLRGMAEAAPCSPDVDIIDNGPGLYVRWRRSERDLASAWLRGEACTLVVFHGPAHDSTKYASVEEALPHLLRWAEAEPIESAQPAPDGEAVEPFGVVCPDRGSFTPDLGVDDRLFGETPGRVFVYTAAAIEQARQEERERCAQKRGRGRDAQRHRTRGLLWRRHVQRRRHGRVPRVRAPRRVGSG